MSQKDFMSHVPDSNILTSDEIIDLTKQFSGVPLQNPLPFLQTPRKETIRDSQKSRRLGTYIPPAVNWCSHIRANPLTAAMIGFLQSYPRPTCKKVTQQAFLQFLELSQSVKGYRLATFIEIWMHLIVTCNRGHS
ncbi:uncharacterized protein LOC114964714 [Acropora millepora]|uniref:uncharacterized protein LOC114964714 n=1 Tax=Acropora millepora TaxID=45264 RepID=UPI001CF1FA1C|nr:uncharacterized protein LOC114964714 [Acropora millepora]